MISSLLQLVVFDLMSGRCHLAVDKHPCGQNQDQATDKYPEICGVYVCIHLQEDWSRGAGVLVADGELRYKVSIQGPIQKSKGINRISLATGDGHR